MLDNADQGESFQAALNCQQQKLSNPELTPAARMLKDMQEQGLEINELAMYLAKRHRRTLLDQGYWQMQAGEFAREAAASRLKQRELEEGDSLGFDDFLRLTLNGPLSAPSPAENGNRGRCLWPTLLDQPLCPCAA